jgi:hypothetical protein
MEEMSKVEDEIRSLRRVVEDMENLKTCAQTEADLDVWNAEIIATETRISGLEERRTTLLQWLEYIRQCSHEFIVDLVDVNPDQSKTVTYCKHCLYVPE